MPFTNLPESQSGRWGEGLTAEKMKKYRRLTSVLVRKFAFVDWTPDGQSTGKRLQFLRLADATWPDQTVTA
jgi:hypothetical protein